MHLRLTVAPLFVSIALTASMQQVHAQNAPLTPRQSEEQFASALNLRDNGDLEQSIVEFEKLLAANPTFDRIRLELAVSHLRAMNFDQARVLAQEVLNRASTPESVKVTVRQFLAEVDKASTPHTFTPFVNVGVMHDSNVNAGPSRDVIDINGLPFAVGPDGVKTSDTAYTAMAGVSHRYQFPSKVGVGKANLTMWWQSQASYYRTTYDTARDYDLDVISLSTGPAVLAGNKWRLVIPYQFSNMYLGGSNLATFSGINPTWIANIGGWEFSVDGQWQKRNYIQSENNPRDSIYTSLGGYVSRSFLNRKLTANLAAHAFEERAQAERYSNRGEDYVATITTRPWTGGEVMLRSSHREARYQGQELMYGFGRRDQETRYTLSVGHTISTGLMEKWSVVLVGSSTHNKSNISIYDYRRKQVSLNLSRSF